MKTPSRFRTDYTAHTPFCITVVLGQQSTVFHYYYLFIINTHTHVVLSVSSTHYKTATTKKRCIIYVWTNPAEFLKFLSYYVYISVCAARIKRGSEKDCERPAKNSNYKTQHTSAVPIQKRHV